MEKDLKKVYQYRKETQKRFEFYIHKDNDEELYDYFMSIPNKRQYILELIRKDMKKHKK